MVPKWRGNSKVIKWKIDLIRKNDMFLVIKIYGKKKYIHWNHLCSASRLSGCQILLMISDSRVAGMNTQQTKNDGHEVAIL